MEYDFLMHRKNGDTWDNIYPISKAKNILTTDNSNVQDTLNSISKTLKDDNTTLKELSKTVEDILGPNASHGNWVPKIETADNSRYLRNDNTWHTISPSDIGAISNNGDNAIGNYIFTNSDNSFNLKTSISDNSWKQGLNMYSSTNTKVGELRFWGYKDSLTAIGFYVNDLKIPVLNIEEDNIYIKGNPVYSAINKPTPSEIGALAANATSVSTKKLAVPIKINGISFDGSKDISVPLVGGDISTNINLNNNNAQITYKNQSLFNVLESNNGYGLTTTAKGRIIIAPNDIYSDIENNTNIDDKHIYLGSTVGISFITSQNATLKSTDRITIETDNYVSGIKGFNGTNENLLIGNFDISGNKNGYSGISFSDYNLYLAIGDNGEDKKGSGVYNGSKWLWYFEEDVLRDGYIPWKNIINKPNSYTPSKHNHDNYIVKSANVIAFTAGTEVPNNNDGKPDGTVYFKYSN